ncbi:interleukin-6 receptor subunit beta-like [Eleutherodactylus coqui]|uniref:interleukin-6 receptor subunit beta-like n=1 Tax=Eleutherodactylus coqui TaxID=57060 RepID=UPI003462A724
MKQLSILCVLWSVVTAADGLSFQSCANITPQSPAVELGKNLTAFCFLDQDCLHELGHPITASELFWMVGKTLIPEGHYTVINDSVSSVTFEPTLSMQNSLTCSFKAYGQTEVTLHGIYFSLGNPPEKPENLICICDDLKTLTCTWEPGRDAIIPTTYTLHLFWEEQERASYSAEAGNNFCTVKGPDIMLNIETTIVVEAVNELGRAESDYVKFDVSDIVKPSPPEIVSASAVLQRVLRIEWKHPIKEHMPFKNLNYNLRYKPRDSTVWGEVPENDLEKTNSSVILEGLEPFTVYVIRIRCKLMNRGFWSEWSKEYTAVTAESAPSQAPEFWRRIRKIDSEQNRTIQLMWKDLDSHANGVILGYKVTMKRGLEVNSFTVTDNTYNIIVSNDSYEVVLTAYNSQGSSPPSTLIIPSITDRVVQPANMNAKMFYKDGRLWVEWTPSAGALGYVIEWCSNSQYMDCDPEWQREPSNTERTFVRGDIKPFSYYFVRLNALHRDGQIRSNIVGPYMLPEGVKLPTGQGCECVCPSKN